MRLYIRLLTCCLTIFFARTSFAQSSSPHTLLWRISGKGLQKPSYLFGTLHLNDKRLFNFDDSVYRAIEKTDGLAIEVNPDEMAAYYVNRLMDQLSNGRLLKDVLGEHYFDRNREALSKRFHKPAGEITTSDVMREKNKWMSEYMKKGEMPTFMDAWLYNVARRQGKWLGGIEDLTDQTGLLNDLVDRSDVDDLLATPDNVQESEGKTGIERMIALYSSGDVDGIRNFTHDNSTPEQEDRLLTHRNRKMARRIDSLVQVRTMFLAIGSAHLAGDSGVINLLRQRGYAVEPVFSTRKMPASDYTFKEVHLPWVTVTDPKGHYRAEMPANPASVRLFGLVNMKFLLDLFNLSGYATMAVVNSNRTVSRDSLFDQLARQMMHGANVKAARRLDQHGIAGREYMESTGDANLRVQLFADDRMVYMAMLSSLKKKDLVSDDAEKFFRSFAIQQQADPGSDAVRPFTDSVMGIRFLSPATLEYNDKLSSIGDSWKIACFTGADPATGAYVMLFSREVRPGYYITADSTVVNDFRERMRTQYEHIVENERTIDGTRAIWMSGRNRANPQLYSSALSLLKNGRNLLLVVVSDSAENSNARLQGVFSSLHFVPPPSMPAVRGAAPDGKWTCTVPSPMRPVVQGAHLRMTWASYDTNTAVSYQVIPDTLNKYRWYADDSLFWKEKIGAFRADSTRAVEVKDVVNGNCSGKELFVESKGNVYCKRVRLLLDGDILYELFVAGEKDFLQSEPVNTFFTSFRATTNAQPNSLTGRKTALLLKDLGSADSATRYDAYMALNNAPFDKADAPALRQALFQEYREPFGSDTAVSTTVNERLSAIIAKLDDSATAAMSVAFVKDSYGSLTGAWGRYRNTALRLLATLHTSYSYSVLKDLFSRGPIPERLGAMVSLEIRDSLQLAAGIFPAFRRWAGDTLQAASVAEIAL
ncbi:MAG TPA: TraB/GumN family protein, partial [Puia sp.]|nr:TraB/GumN family protein [Puia sp.]